MSPAQVEDNKEDPSRGEGGPQQTEEAPAGTIAAEYSTKDRNRAIRHLDFNLIPLLGALYLLTYIDRGNIGNAYTAGMGEDWGITSNQYSWIITAYYLGYIAFHGLTLMWKVVPVPIWVALMALGWGASSMLQAATTNFAGLMALRFLIGVFEAGFAPGIALFLSYFYSRSEMGLRLGIWASFATIANCFASALAYAIVHAKTGIAEWRLLLIIEGIPTIIIAPIAYIFLPRGPGQCRFLNKRENEIIRFHALRARGNDTNRTVNLKQVLAAVYDYKNYLQAAILFCLLASFGSLPVFLPSIIKDLGYSSIDAQGLSAPPYLVAFVVCIGASFLSDQVGNRSYFISALSLLSAVGYLLQALLKGSAIRYFSIYLVTAGAFPSVSLNYTWVTDNQGSSSKRGAGIAVFSMIGQAGGIAGSRFYPKEEGPYYVKGMAISAGLLFFAALLAQVLRLLMAWENKRRDAAYGPVDNREVLDEVRDSGDDHPSFRFIL